MIHSLCKRPSPKIGDMVQLHPSLRVCTLGNARHAIFVILQRTFVATYTDCQSYIAKTLEICCLGYTAGPTYIIDCWDDGRIRVDDQVAVLLHPEEAMLAALPFPELQLYAPQQRA